MAESNLAPFSKEPFKPWNNPDKEIIKEGCKLCRSEFRTATEKIYTETKSLTKAVNFVKEKGEVISYNAVRNHLIYHFNSQSNNSLLYEYADEVNRWLEIQDDTPAALRRTIATLDREMNILAANSEGTNVDVRRKNIDIIDKLAKTLLAYRVKYDEMSRKKEPVTIVFQQLQIIVNEEIKKINSQEAKTAMANVLDRLQNVVGEMLIEEESNE